MQFSNDQLVPPPSEFILKITSRLIPAIGPTHDMNYDIIQKTGRTIMYRNAVREGPSYGGRQSAQKW